MLNSSACTHLMCTYHHKQNFHCKRSLKKWYKIDLSLGWQMLVIWNTAATCTGTAFGMAGIWCWAHFQRHSIPVSKLYFSPCLPMQISACFIWGNWGPKKNFSVQKLLPDFPITPAPSAQDHKASICKKIHKVSSEITSNRRGATLIFGMQKYYKQERPMQATGERSGTWGMQHTTSLAMLRAQP